MRLEIATPLHREVRLIPVLTDGAAMSLAEALPDDLKPLVRRQAVELRNSRWDVDVQGLIATLERTVSASRAAESPGPSADQSAKRSASTIGSTARRWQRKAPSLRMIGASSATLLTLGILVAYFFLIPPAKLVATLEGHEEGIIIRQLAHLPDGRLASASADKTVKIWNLATRKAEATLNHDRPVVGLVPLPNERLISFDEEGMVRLWDLRSGKVVRDLERITSQLGDNFVPLGEGRFAAGTRGGIKVWNLATGLIERMLRLDDDYPLIDKLALLRDGRLATGDHLGTVRIWNLLSGQPEVIVSKGKGYGRSGGGTDGVTGLTELKDGMLAFSTWSGKEVAIANPTSGKKEKARRRYGSPTCGAQGWATCRAGREESHHTLEPDKGNKECRLPRGSYAK